MSSINDFKIENGVLVKHRGNEEKVTIPEGITTIGDCAFSSCSSLKEVTIPESVTTIGSSAFQDCKRINKSYHRCCFL